MSPLRGALAEGYALVMVSMEGCPDPLLSPNVPTVLPTARLEMLLQVARRTYEDPTGRPHPYLTEEEMRYLTIPKGSLDETERLEIESHVTHTYRFLQQIPWTRELQDIPMIAYGHHEKLDGKGYPRRVTGQAIPIQTRMMTISDIYDALSAADRPYKAAVAPARAADLMAEAVRAGQLEVGRASCRDREA